MHLRILVCVHSVIDTSDPVMHPRVLVFGVAVQVALVRVREQRPPFAPIVVVCRPARDADCTALLPAAAIIQLFDLDVFVFSTAHPGIGQHFPRCRAL